MRPGNAEIALAHMIRARRTLNARAIYAIDAIHRWCITGTPLQNRVGDISSLLQFLRVHPYDQPNTFEAEIIRPWKENINKKPLYRLRTLMKMIALHRTKNAITLPVREESIQEVDFNTEERDIYDKAREGTIRLIDQTLSSRQTSRSIYFNAFQRINEMRYICNHGIRHRKQNSELAGAADGEAGSSMAQDELEHLLDNSDQACLNCGTDISEEQETLGQPSSLGIVAHDDQRRLCTSCLQKHTGTASQQLQTPPASQSDKMELCQSEKELPSKVKAVISYVSDISAEEKWYVILVHRGCFRLNEVAVANEGSVIFSFWTSTLDIVEQGLKDVGILCYRYQGSLTYAKRTETLMQFRCDPFVRVILVSITCGGQG